jgi:hypothetical protein
MAKITINWGDLEMALDINDYDTEAYLDKETGVVITKDDYTLEMMGDALEADSLEEALKMIEENEDIADFGRELTMHIARIEWDETGRYLELRKQDSHDGYSDMEDYIEIVEDEHLAELLSVAIQGKGAFRRFKDVLLNYPDAREAWFVFENSQKQKRALEWLQDNDIEAEFV